VPAKASAWQPTLAAFTQPSQFARIMATEGDDTEAVGTIWL